MSKNVIVIALIFAIPLIAYFVISANQKTHVNQDATGKAQVIKFSSKMCIDCKKIAEVLEDVFPKYEDRVALIEINVQSNDKETENLITKYNVTLVPTLVFIDKNGKQVRRTEGALEQSILESYLEELCND